MAAWFFTIHFLHEQGSVLRIRGETARQYNAAPPPPLEI
jgi:hypothetical protein